MMMKLGSTLMLSAAALQASVIVSFQPTAFRRHHVSQTSLGYSTETNEDIKTATNAKEVLIERHGLKFLFDDDLIDSQGLSRRIEDAMKGAEVLATTTTTTAPEKTVDDIRLTELRSKELKDLKLECSRRSIKYAGFEEKEDYVQAIWEQTKEVLGYSVSGVVRPGEATLVSGKQLDEEITSSDTPILVDVFALWCGPCAMMSRQLDGVAAELGSKVRVVKLNTEQDPEWASKYKVMGLPTLLLIKNGQVQQRFEGVVAKEKLLEHMESHI